MRDLRRAENYASARLVRGNNKENMSSQQKKTKHSANKKQSSWFSIQAVNKQNRQGSFLFDRLHNIPDVSEEFLSPLEIISEVMQKVDAPAEGKPNTYGVRWLNFTERKLVRLENGEDLSPAKPKKAPAKKSKKVQKKKTIKDKKPTEKKDAPSPPPPPPPPPSLVELKKENPDATFCKPERM